MHHALRVVPEDHRKARKHSARTGWRNREYGRLLGKESGLLADVLSYEKYCLGSVEMMDKWDDGRPYFWYCVGNYINYYLLASDAGDGTWSVHSGYIDAHSGYIDACKEDIDFNFYMSNSEDYMIVYETDFPQIEWPIGDNLKLEGFDITIIRRECGDALEYLEVFKKTHSLDEQDDTYKIIWDII